MRGVPPPLMGVNPQCRGRLHRHWLSTPGHTYRRRHSPPSTAGTDNLGTTMCLMPDGGELFTSLSLVLGIRKLGRRHDRASGTILRGRFLSRRPFGAPNRSLTKKKDRNFGVLLRFEPAERPLSAIWDACRVTGAPAGEDDDVLAVLAPIETEELVPFDARDRGPSCAPKARPRARASVRAFDPGPVGVCRA